MCKNILLFMLLFFSITLMSQPLKIKEEYDLYSINRINIQSQSYTYCNIHPNNDLDYKYYGDHLSKILEGYLIMYQTTGDKAYLYKFILQSLCIVENRHDYQPLIEPNEPKWTGGETNYQDGYIIAVMAKYAYLIKNVYYNKLYNEQLYQFEELKYQNYTPNTCNCNKFKPFYTFGEYAEWLQGRVGETLWWFLSNGYWDNNEGMKKTTSQIAEVNMQVGFARAMMYVGLSSNNISLLSKSAFIASKFKAPVYCNDLPPLFLPSMLLYNSSNNSYGWWSKGWKIDYNNCSTKYFEHMEDISHGDIVTWLPYEMNQLFPNNSYFTNIDMVRFRNMFTSNIYDGNGGFYNSVFGTDNPIFSNNCSTNSCPHNMHEHITLGYVRFSDFDNLPNTTGSLTPYQIVMNHYSNFKTGFNTLPNNGYAAQSNRGHAELVKAQWERECFNLSLYNRKMVYNQDFWAKNNLTVFPGQYNGFTFAEPRSTNTISNDFFNTDEFIVEPLVNVHMEAGNKITLKPGFKAKKGSFYKASINTNLCSASNSRKNYTKGYPTYNLDSLLSLNVSVDKTFNKNKDLHFSLSPNPSKTGVFTVETNCQNPYKIVVYNIQGQQLLNLNSSNKVEKINMHNFEKGVYVLHLLVSKKIFTKKLIIQ